MPDSFILHDWQNFYLLTGTASATLIGLIFVAISFGARLVPTQAETAVRAFVTPTVIHFGLVLILSILTLIPAYTNQSLAVMLIFIGGIGILYSARVMRQMLLHHEKQQALNMHHWKWHLIFPVTCYFLIFGSGLALFPSFLWMLNVLALAVTGLIFIGLRNAFDLMMWIAHQPI
jgi:hypothetical protein